MDPQNKRKSASNWTTEMMQLLVSLIKPLGHIIDSELNSQPMIKVKSEAWDKIKEAFEANGHQVSTKQLRGQWNRQTVGGSPLKEPREMDYEVEETAKDDFVEGFSAYDCDGEYTYEQEEIENESSNDIKPLETLMINKVDLETHNKTDANMKDKATVPKKPAVNKKRAFPTVVSLEELLQKKILQVEDETRAKKNIFKLKEQKERMKINIQKKKLRLLNMQIRKRVFK